jgi:hypothetical protein
VASRQQVTEKYNLEAYQSVAAGGFMPEVGWHFFNHSGDWKCVVWLSSGPDCFRLLEL